MAARKRKSATVEQVEGSEPEVTPQAAGDPGQCGETPCWSRTPITVSATVAGLDATFTSPWSGPISYDFGDGSSGRDRGDTTHTYAAAGTYNVVARPVASSCAGPSAPVPVTVA